MAGIVTVVDHVGEAERRIYRYRGGVAQLPGACTGPSCSPTELQSAVEGLELVGA